MSGFIRDAAAAAPEWMLNCPAGARPASRIASWSHVTRQPTDHDMTSPLHGFAAPASDLLIIPPHEPPR
jgi:hypothetical protein